jgi:hypothetical protein
LCIATPQNGQSDTSSLPVGDAFDNNPELGRLDVALIFPESIPLSRFAGIIASPVIGPGMCRLTGDLFDGLRKVPAEVARLSGKANHWKVLIYNLSYKYLLTCMQLLVYKTDSTSAVRFSFCEKISCHVPRSPRRSMDLALKGIHALSHSSHICAHRAGIRAATSSPDGLGNLGRDGRHEHWPG